MKRRAFVTGLGAVLAAPCGAGAQQGKMFKIGLLLCKSYRYERLRILTPSSERVRTVALTR